MNHEETIDDATVGDGVSLHLKKLYEAIRRLTGPLTSSQSAQRLKNALKAPKSTQGP